MAVQELHVDSDFDGPHWIMRDNACFTSESLGLFCLKIPCVCYCFTLCSKGIFWCYNVFFLCVQQWGHCKTKAGGGCGIIIFFSIFSHYLCTLADCVLR